MNIVIQKWTSISFIVKKKRKGKEITQNICTLKTGKAHFQISSAEFVICSGNSRAEIHSNVYKRQSDSEVLISYLFILMTSRERDFCLRKLNSVVEV